MPRRTAKAKTGRSIPERREAIARHSSFVLSPEERAQKRAAFFSDLDSILPKKPSFRMDEIMSFAERSRGYIYNAADSGRLLMSGGRASFTALRDFLATEVGL